MLVLNVGSIASFLAIYLTAVWQFFQIVTQNRRKVRNLVVPVVVLFFILGLELVGFVNP